MQFKGVELAAILESQAEPVGVFDDSGLFREDAEPAIALKIACDGQFVGIGHRKRIRYIRPASTRLGCSGGGQTTRRIVNDAGVIISAPKIREFRYQPARLPAAAPVVRFRAGNETQVAHFYTHPHKPAGREIRKDS
jgi:hypothetical protein